VIVGRPVRKRIKKTQQHDFLRIIFFLLYIFNWVKLKSKLVEEKGQMPFITSPRRFLFCHQTTMPLCKTRPVLDWFHNSGI